MLAVFERAVQWWVRGIYADWPARGRVLIRSQRHATLIIKMDFADFPKRHSES